MVIIIFFGPKLYLLALEALLEDFPFGKKVFYLAEKFAEFSPFLGYIFSLSEYFIKFIHINV